MTSPPTKPVAPVTMSFMLQLDVRSLEYAKLLKLKDESRNEMGDFCCWFFVLAYMMRSQRRGTEVPPLTMHT